MVSRVVVEKNDEKIKAGLAISTKEFIDRLYIGGDKLGAEILEELKEIRAMQRKVITFIEYEHKWYNYM